ncbi:MAG: hypothetical protein WD426_14510 [Anditalea sp.]
MKKSPLQHTIIKPTGFFSGLNDLVIMGKKGFIPVIGSGKFLTNPIHPTDLAEKVLELLWDGPDTIEIGGPETLSRKDIALVIQKKTQARIVHLPEVLVRSGTRDMVAPNYGSLTFDAYIDQLDLEELP